jgi:hypothetical protein
MFNGWNRFERSSVGLKAPTCAKTGKAWGTRLLIVS